MSESVNIDTIEVYAQYSGTAGQDFAIKIKSIPEPTHGIYYTIYIRFDPNANLSRIGRIYTISTEGRIQVEATITDRHISPILGVVLSRPASSIMCGLEFDGAIPWDGSEIPLNGINITSNAYRL